MMRFMRFLGALRNWTTGHWLRSVIVGVTILSLIGITIGGWAYLASVMRVDDHPFGVNPHPELVRS